jgi:hypothetical protein
MNPLVSELVLFINLEVMLMSCLMLLTGRILYAGMHVCMNVTRGVCTCTRARLQNGFGLYILHGHDPQQCIRRRINKGCELALRQWHMPGNRMGGTTHITQELSKKLGWLKANSNLSTDSGCLTL